MSGRRCKAIRKAYFAAHKKAPGGILARDPYASLVPERSRRVLGIGDFHYVSEWRRLKKAYNRANSGRGTTVTL